MHELVTRTITGFVLALVAWFIFFQAPVYILSICFFAVLITILVKEWPQFKLWWLTAFYPVLPFVCLILLNQSQYRALLFLLFIMVYSHDTGAYCTGKLFGKHKIAPTISPGKTWEGFFGGLLLSYCASFIAIKYMGFNPSLIFLVFFILIINILAVLGDLFESYLKRRVHIKDSGTLLPGHGGLLDRFDSLMFAGPLIYLLTFNSFFLAQFF